MRPEVPPPVPHLAIVNDGDLSALTHRLSDALSAALVRCLPMTRALPAQATDLHNERLYQVDRLIPAAPVPAPEASDVVLEADGAVGIVRTRRIDPNALDACWGALTRRILASPRVYGDDPLASMDALLTSWAKVVATAPAEADTTAVVSWPSRDTAVTAAFVDHGLSPRVVLAARAAGRPTPMVTSGLGGLTIRPIEERDLTAAAERFLDVIRWDSQFRGSYVRESTPAAVHLDLQHSLQSEGTVVLGRRHWRPDRRARHPGVAGRRGMDRAAGGRRSGTGRLPRCDVGAAGPGAVAASARRWPHTCIGRRMRPASRPRCCTTPP